MTHETQTTLEEYTELFRELKERTGDPYAAAIILQEMARDARGAQMRAERAAVKDTVRTPAYNARRSYGNESATERQLKLLQHLNVPVPRDLTKAQASALLDEALARQEAR